MPGSGLSQWPRWAGGGARARWDLGLRAGGGRRAGGGGDAGWNAAELLPPPPQPPPPQRRGHVVWCVGRGEEEEGVKPREETGERHHTHTAQDGRRGSSTPSCQALRRGRGTRRLAGSCAGAARRPAGAKRPRPETEVGRARRWGVGSPRQRRPERPPDPRRPKCRCGSGRGRLPGVRAALRGAGDRALRGNRRAGGPEVAGGCVRTG